MVPVSREYCLFQKLPIFVYVYLNFVIVQMQTKDIGRLPQSGTGVFETQCSSMGLAANGFGHDESNLALVAGTK